MEHLILVNGILEQMKEMGEELSFGLMAAYMTGNGEIAKQTEREGSFIRTEMYMKGIGSMIKLRETAFILIWMGQCIEVNGKMISNMAMGKKPGPIKLFTMATISVERSREREISNGQTMQLIMEISSKITFMGLEPINGQTGEYILVVGKIIKCMAKVYSNGKMAAVMKAVTLRTKKSDRVCLNGKSFAIFSFSRLIILLILGLMGENTAANGLMENRMERALLLHHRVRENKENGKMEKGCDGLMK